MSGQLTTVREPGSEGEGEPVLGILGGLGPLATAEFLRTVYETNMTASEQDLPRCIVDSDPGIPDRTEAIRSGVERPVLERLNERIRGLLEAGATKVVPTCVTVHHFLRKLDPSVTARTVSLIDVVIEELRSTNGPLLMLCTHGTRLGRIFENSPEWPEVADRVVWPDAELQESVHHLIYLMKRAGKQPGMTDTVERWLDATGCPAVITGCTEFHLLTGELARRRGPDAIVDPLRSVAADLRRAVGDGTRPEPAPTL
ncbi:aspartate/glutamate racemase family protein [Streptomyces pini]|uniref:Aspartate racemase n=1 Tax=Streptomyces pini TaxID=1520580 RepID=A0A1I4GSB8_9ACTN|nr:aspartate/glutamate racemase family protein [Streptomyces pini]SFL32972.1 aspartate racemase [Streptomyces pini]